MSSRNSTRNANKTNWLECGKCKGFDIFQSGVLEGDADTKNAKDLKYECRMCKLETRQLNFEEIWAKRTQNFELTLTRRINQVQTDVNALCARMLKIERPNEEVCVDEARREMASDLLVNDLLREDKFEALEGKVSVLEDRVTAFEVHVAEVKQDWPKPEEWKEIKAKRGQKGRAAASSEGKPMSFAEKYKNRKRDTVHVIGDSLVRGVGKKLEANSHMFTATSRPGYKIEDIEKEVSRLQNNKDRHLVVMVGTNNCQEDYSEEMLEKYEKLIKQCKSVESRAVTIVGIPRRCDLDSEQDSRRIGVNKRLALKCKEYKVEYIGYECGRNRLARDGLHLNDLGQDEFAQVIFTHCKYFLG